ncbi:DUF2839 domain-containing protein [Lusitaniella coriacea LEGE 07157]|uniref:DUF2839 domain-containing protein n=1 Tax=Lusitaniella coriacea LEGE 07157 TaxID=945747 RepID=A0A8J7J9G6_9CYAN|nr:DUF2839 domain-containing protein [Lusitaniella coriacea]MBE9115545.1 DUF2839 domain-containing protein [Lusitaniella coriacea LEGE 07157]
MGEAKRRKESLGDRYGKEDKILPWVPITKTQGEQFVKWTTKGAWIGIGLVVAFWVVVRIIGPAFGWWTVQ